MSESFNPYLKWLGIPLKDQPPNHYRLLGIEPLERDPDVIENAADRQMAHVRNFSTGKHMELSQQLLQELAAARLCLLTAEKKKAYDAKLKQAEQKKKAAQQKASDKSNRSSAKPAKQPPPKAAPASAAMPRASALPAAPKPKAVAAPVAVTGKPPESENTSTPVHVAASQPAIGRRRKQQPIILWAVLGGGALLALGLAALVLPGLLAPGEDRFATSDPEPGSEVVQPAITTQPRDTDPQPEIQIPNPDTEPNDPPADPDNEQPLPEVDPPDPQPADGDDNPEDQPDTPDPDTQPAEPTDGDDPETPPARPKPPSGEVLAAIKQRVGSLYRFDNLSLDQQRVLAKKILEDGLATGDNLDDRFVMLHTAATSASEAGELSTAMEAVDAIEKQYDGKFTPLRLELAATATKAAPADEKAEVARASLAVIDAAMSRSAYAEVEKLTLELLSLTRRLGDRDLTAALIERRRSSEAMAKMYTEAIAGVATLAAEPDNAPANLAVGSFWAFAKENWEKAWPHLQQGSDAALAEIARQELAEPSEADAQAALADAWFVRARKSEAPVSHAMLRRARHWFTAAEDDATGLTRTTVERRLEEIAKALGPGDSASPKEQSAQIVASCDSGFDMYLNGQLLLSGKRLAVESTTQTLKSGDVITVQGSNLRREKGFAATIKFDDGKTIATGQANAWQLYVPSDAANWFDPGGIARVLPAVAGDGSQHQQVEQQSGVACASIWSNNPFRAYLVLQIP